MSEDSADGSWDRQDRLDELLQKVSSRESAESTTRRTEWTEEDRAKVVAALKEISDGKEEK